MSCPHLKFLRSAPLEGLLSRLREKFPEVLLEFHMNNILETHPNDIQAQLGELLYYKLGSELASSRSWNNMTFLQLQHEAQVQGLIGPGPYGLSEWDLRLKLELEARRIDMEQEGSL